MHIAFLIACVVALNVLIDFAFPAIGGLIFQAIGCAIPIAIGYGILCAVRWLFKR